MEPLTLFKSPVPRVPIDLDRRRHLRLDLDALFAAEQELIRLWQRPVNIISVMLDPAGIGLTVTAVLLWAGLRHEDPRLALTQVQRLLDLNSLNVYVDAIQAVWNLDTASAESQEVVSESDPLARPSPGDAFGALDGSNSALATTSSGS